MQPYQTTLKYYCIFQNINIFFSEHQHRHRNKSEHKENTNQHNKFLSLLEIERDSGKGRQQTLVLFCS